MVARGIDSEAIDMVIDLDTLWHGDIPPWLRHTYTESYVETFLELIAEGFSHDIAHDIAASLESPAVETLDDDDSLV